MGAHDDDVIEIEVPHVPLWRRVWQAARVKVRVPAWLVVLAWIVATTHTVQWVAGWFR